MRQFRTSGSVGGQGERSPWSTRHPGLLGLAPSTTPAALTLQFPLAPTIGGYALHLQPAAFEPVPGGTSVSDAATLHVGYWSRVASCWPILIVLVSTDARCVRARPSAADADRQHKRWSLQTRNPQLPSVGVFRFQHPECSICES